MKLVYVGGYHINPEAIAYVRAVNRGPAAVGGPKQTSEVFFVGTSAPLAIDLTPGAFRDELERGSGAR